MKRAFRLALCCAGLMHGLAWGADVRKTDGVEIITGRPVQPASTAGASGRARAGTALPPAAPAANRDRALPPTLPPTLPERGAQAGTARPAVGTSVATERLRGAEAVLQDQISAYNRALLENAGPAVLAPLEAAISRTLDHIEMLVRTARPQEP